MRAWASKSKALYGSMLSTQIGRGLTNRPPSIQPILPNQPIFTAAWEQAHGPSGSHPSTGLSPDTLLPHPQSPPHRLPIPPGTGVRHATAHEGAVVRPRHRSPQPIIIATRSGGLVFFWGKGMIDRQILADGFSVVVSYGPMMWKSGCFCDNQFADCRTRDEGTGAY